MPIQLLRDANIKPNAKVIASCLKEADNTYKNFIIKLNEDNISIMPWRYYNDGKTWLSKGEYKWLTTRGAQKVKTIFWLSIWERFFKISFFFSYNMKEELLKLPISKETKELIKEANPMGKTMRFMPIVFSVNNDQQLDDILVLASFKKDIN